MKLSADCHYSNIRAVARCSLSVDSSHRPNQHCATQ
jgi:hypothetical protein